MEYNRPLLFLHLRITKTPFIIAFVFIPICIKLLFVTIYNIVISCTSIFNRFIFKFNSYYNRRVIILFKKKLCYVHIIYYYVAIWDMVYGIYYMVYSYIEYYVIFLGCSWIFRPILLHDCAYLKFFFENIIYIANI